MCIAACETRACIGMCEIPLTTEYVQASREPDCSASEFTIMAIMAIIEPQGARWWRTPPQPPDGDHFNLCPAVIGQPGSAAEHDESIVAATQSRHPDSAAEHDESTCAVRSSSAKKHIASVPPERIVITSDSSSTSSSIDYSGNPASSSSGVVAFVLVVALFVVDVVLIVGVWW